MVHFDNGELPNKWTKPNFNPHKSIQSLSVLILTISRCQSNVKRYKVQDMTWPSGDTCDETSMTIPVSWQQIQAGPENSVMIQWWICSYDVAKELKGSGMDDAGKWWLLIMSADLLSGQAGPLRNTKNTMQTLLIECIQVPQAVMWKARFLFHKR